MARPGFVRARQPESFVRPVTAALHELDPTLVVSNVRTIESALAESLARGRISALISTSFGVGGLLLAALGLYGLLAYLVAGGTKDIGIRIALGARVARITGSVVAGGLALVAIGAAIVVASSLVLLRALGGLLFGVTPYDVPTYVYVIVVVLLRATAAFASYLPARRAARIEPLMALRQEEIKRSQRLDAPTSNGTQDSSCSQGQHGPNRQALDGRLGPLLY